MFRFGLVLLALGLACASGEPPTPAEPTKRARSATSDVAERGRWVYAHDRAASLGVDRLDAPFDQLTAPCMLSHEGTGGTGRAWHPDDDCGFTSSGFRMKGEWTSLCYGASPGQHPPWCDPDDASQNERVDRVIDFQAGDDCAALFDGHPFIQDQGCAG